MPEVPNPREHHGQPHLVCGPDHLLVPHGAARLDRRPRARFRGGEEPVNDDRPVPPAVEEARFAEDRATEPLSEAAEEGGLAEDQPTGLADPVESAEEIAPEEDPTTSYSGSESAVREEDTSDGPEGGATPAPYGESTSNQEGEAADRAESEGEESSEVPAERPSAGDEE